jgi:predicted ATPase
VVALHVAKPGQLVYLEQPELHLHPRAQEQLAQILANAVKRGIQVVIETHSSLLLLGIQTLIAEEKLEADAVRLHWFQRPKGVTEIKTANIDADGSFGDWPVDFGEVSLNAQSRYLDAVDARYAKHAHPEN